MIRRITIAVLRVSCALFAVVLLVLAADVLFWSRDFMERFIIGAISCVLFWVLAHLWGWQVLLRRLEPKTVDAEVHAPQWVRPRQQRRRASVLTHESWSSAPPPKGGSTNKMAGDSLYTPEYTPDTGDECTSSRPASRAREERGA